MLRVPNVWKSSLGVILASPTLFVSRTVLEQVFVPLEISYPLQRALLELHSRVIGIAAILSYFSPKLRVNFRSFLKN